MSPTRVVGKHEIHLNQESSVVPLKCEAPSTKDPFPIKPPSDIAMQEQQPQHTVGHV